MDSQTGNHAVEKDEKGEYREVHVHFSFLVMLLEWVSAEPHKVA